VAVVLAGFTRDRKLIATARRLLLAEQHAPASAASGARQLHLDMA
jgi:hypothetical protein